jgi:hypothetical protein
LDEKRSEIPFHKDEISALSGKLNQWASQNLNSDEIVLLNILLRDAERGWSCDPCCPNIIIEDNIEQAAYRALRPNIGYDKACKEKDIILWRRTAALT